MSTAFNAHGGLILINAWLIGSAAESMALPALDTGADTTLISVEKLVSIGVSPTASPSRVEVTTASGLVYMPLVSVDGIEALGLRRNSFAVVAHTIPQSAGVDGVLGLDFLRGHVLTVDFRKGRISLR